MSTDSQTEFKEEKYRYVNLVIYLLAALVNSLPAQTFSSINSQVEQQFHISAILVTLNTLLFPILHPIGAFPVNWMLDTIGMKFGCSVGGLVLIAGVWLRTLLDVEQPWLCLVGSALAAFGNIFILNSPSKLASQWFAPQSIPVVISITVLASNISITMGASIPALVLGTGATIDQFKNFLIIQAIIVTIPIALMIILLRNKPTNPPSEVANQQMNLPKQSYISTLKKMFTNRQYILIMFAMSFSYGTMISVLATLEQCLNTLGYEKSGRMTSIILLTAMIIGIISTIVFSYVVKKTFAFKKILILLLLGTSVSLTGLFFLLIDQINAQIGVLMIVLSCCAGIFLVPQSSILIGYASEVIYPLGQASASGYQYAASQTFGFLLGLGVISFIDKDTHWKVYTVFGIQTALFLLAAFFILLTKQTLKRSKESIRLRSSISNKLEDSLIVGDLNLGSEDKDT